MPVIMPANLTLADCSPSLLAAAAVVLLVVLQLGRTWWRLRHIPGPFFAKFTNFQRVYWVKTKRAHLILQEAHEKYGELVRIGPNTVSIHNPGLIPTIYTARTGFPKSDFYPTLQAYTPNGGSLEAIFNTTSDEVHKKLKTPIAPLFTLANIPSLEPRVNEVLECIHEKLEEKFVGNDQVFNLGDWLQFFAFDVMGTLTFSKRYGFLDSGKDVGGMLASIVFFMRTSAPFTQMPKIDWLLRKNRVGDAIQRALGLQASMSIMGFVAKAIAEKREALANNVEKREVENDKYARGSDFLTRYVEVSQQDPSLPPSAPAAWTFSNVIAGSDSVGSLMRTTMYNLLVYPHTFEKLFKELKDANVSRPYPTWTEIRNLPYLDACVQEGIRMHPPFALPFERVVPKGGITIAGQHLPEGTDVGGNAYVVNRHKGWFGDDAEFWRPERWIEKDEAHKRKLEAGILTVSAFPNIHGPDTAFAFSWFLYVARLLTVLPKFGGGRRICIGRYVGILEIKKILAFLIANYDIHVVDPHRFQYENSWFFFQKGLYARIEKRPEVGE